MSKRRSILLTALLCALAPQVLGATRTGINQAMRPATSAAFLRSFLAERRISLTNMSVRQVVDVSLEFYKNVPAQGLSTGPSADMLLYQWGAYDIGKDSYFEFDITRQFIELGSTGDKGMSQLHVTAYLAASKSLRAIKASNLWWDEKSDVRGLTSYIASSPAFTAVKDLVPLKVEIAWSPV